VPSNESEDARLQQVQRLESTLKDLEVAAARLVAGQVG
jgi:hypothetical protein